MKHTLGTIVAVLALATAASAQHPKTDAGVAGTWNVGLQGDHVVQVALELKQDGRTVTGTLTMPTQNVGQRVDVAMSGEFADGTLKISGTVEHAKEPTTIELTGALKEDGTIEGTVAMPAHKVPFTAERLRERKKSGGR